MTNIQPLDQLDAGTLVNVQGKRGTVLSCKVEPASGNSGGYVAVHTIHFTERFAGRTFGKAVYKPMDKTSRVNYASIQLR